LVFAWYLASNPKAISEDIEIGLTATAVIFPFWIKVG
jgi:hypothetical protein